jgi:hypothetical protein
MSRRSPSRRPRLTVEPFEERVVPAAPTDSFVAAAYGALLHRTVEGQGLSYRDAVAQQGGGPDGVIAGLMCSTEANAKLQQTTGSSTGTSSDTTTTAGAAAVATHFLILTPKSAAAGVAGTVVVEALDASNHRVPNYTGTVQLTSSDAGATLAGAALPATYTFQAGDHGAHIFEVTFSAAGSPTLTATDAADGTLTGTVTVTVGSASTSADPHGYGSGAADQVFQQFPPRF